MESKWIYFVLVKEGLKTNAWIVTARESQEKLGEIKWFGRWRKYAFFPYEGTVYEPTCLKDIAEFIEDQMRRRKKCSLSG